MHHILAGLTKAYDVVIEVLLDGKQSIADLQARLQLTESRLTPGSHGQPGGTSFMSTSPPGGAPGQKWCDLHLCCWLVLLYLPFAACVGLVAV